MPSRPHLDSEALHFHLHVLSFAEFKRYLGFHKFTVVEKKSSNFADWFTFFPELRFIACIYRFRGHKNVVFVSRTALRLTKTAFRF